MKLDPADSLPSHDSAKNIVWSAQQLSFLIENGLIKDVAFCFRLQPLQCLCAWNESNWQRIFFLCQHSQLCQSLACFHKQRLWTKFPTPLLAADVFPHQRIGFTIGVRWERIWHCTFHQRPKCNVRYDPTPPHPHVVTKQVSGVASQWRSKCNIRYYPTPPHPHVVTKQVSGVASQWRSKCNVRCYPTPPNPNPTPSPCWHAASKWRSKSVTKQVQRTLLPHPNPTPPHPHVDTKQVSGVASQWRSTCNVRYYPTPPQPHPIPMLTRSK